MAHFASASGNLVLLAVSALVVVNGDLGTSLLDSLQTVIGAVGGRLSQKVFRK